jgi:hypothetical protein
MAKMVCDKIEYNVGYSQPVGQRAIQNVKGIKIKGAPTSQPPASSLQPASTFEIASYKKMRTKTSLLEISRIIN